VVDYLIHYYRKGARPFQTLSALPEEEALEHMRRLYIEGSIFWERFENPKAYLDFRRQIERNIREAFIAKGGKPRDPWPIYCVLGRPKWTSTVLDASTAATTDEIQIPLSLLDWYDLSFTYPDSMVSAMMVQEKNPDYYEPDYHGKVFTQDEIAEIIKRKGLPGEGWQTRMPPRLAHYIEAQVWNHAPLVRFLTKIERKRQA
jgi:hypothetical protein